VRRDLQLRRTRTSGPLGHPGVHANARLEAADGLPHLPGMCPPLPRLGLPVVTSHILLVGAGPSWADAKQLDKSRFSHIVGIQRALRETPDLDFGYAFLHDRHSVKYLKDIRRPVTAIVTAHYQTRQFEACSMPHPVKFVPFPCEKRFARIGTGPMALLWAINQPDVQSVTLCGFNPEPPGAWANRQVGSYQHQWAGWRLLAEELTDLATPVVLESPNCSLDLFERLR